MSNLSFLPKRWGRGQIFHSPGKGPRYTPFHRGKQSFPIPREIFDFSGSAHKVPLNSAATVSRFPKTGAAVYIRWRGYRNPSVRSNWNTDESRKAVKGASMRTAGRKRPSGINANRPSNRKLLCRFSSARGLNDNGVVANSAGRR